LSGILAWWAWLLIHILLLIGFRNRAVVLLEWAWAYLTFQRGARLITDDYARVIGRVAHPSAHTSGPESPVPDSQNQKNPAA